MYFMYFGYPGTASLFITPQL